MWRCSRAAPRAGQRAGAIAVPLAMAGFALILGACATAPLPPQSPPIAAPTAPGIPASAAAPADRPAAADAAPSPASATALHYAGRFSVTWREAADDDTGQRAIGRFLLRVAPSRSELEVSSPLGQTLAVATVAPGAASLTTADGRQIRAERPEALTQRAFGWPAPLAELPRWLAAPAGRPQPLAFEDSGWQVAIETWQDGLPRRLVLRWPSAGTSPGSATVREVELRLLIDEALAEAPRP
jgi:outer membrane lipoprotein LolB